MHLGFEHRRFARGAQALAVYYAHTAPTAFGGVADELAQGFTCFVTAQAMQIDLPLQTPMPFAQFLRNVGADALATVAEFVVGIEQG